MHHNCWVCDTHLQCPSDMNLYLADTSISDLSPPSLGLFGGCFCCFRPVTQPNLFLNLAQRQGTSPISTPSSCDTSVHDTSRHSCSGQGVISPSLVSSVCCTQALHMLKCSWRALTISSKNSIAEFLNKTTRLAIWWEKSSCKCLTCV